MKNKKKSKKRNTKPKDDLNVHNIISSKKLRISLALIFILFFLLIARLFYLQIIDGAYLANLASKQQIKSEEISSKRGNIYDTTGASLAISEPVDTISINPKNIKGKTDEETANLKETVAKGLSEIFELDYNAVLEKVNSSSSSETIIRKVEEDKVNTLREWMKENNVSSGINIDEDVKRYYPNGNLASQIIGICGTDNQGLSGIESSYDSILTGTSGEITTSKDASQSEIPNSQQSFIAAENGYDLTLTIDVKIQAIAERCLKEGVEANSCSKGGNVIIMNPQNGQILAMASCPDYDLNNPRVPTGYFADGWDNLSDTEQMDRLYEMWKVRSVSETYEPGSVFKLITAAVALEENITETDIAGDFFCNGFETVNGLDIRCWYAQNPYNKTHGYQSLREALMNSCNPALMQLVRRIGAETMTKYMGAFGLFNKTGVGLSGESSGVFYNSIDEINAVELATLAFGQRFNVTPLQMCTAVAAIANNGYLVTPQLVKSITNTDTGETTEFGTNVVRQAVSSTTANQVKDMMLSVVTDGTGTRAQVDGYTIGGKSGTSEPIAGSTEYVTSFAAISPIENTQVVVLVTLYDPKGNSHQGGSTAAPVVHNILAEVLPYLGVEPNM